MCKYPWEGFGRRLKDLHEITWGKFEIYLKKIYMDNWIRVGQESKIKFYMDIGEMLCEFHDPV